VPKRERLYTVVLTPKKGEHFGTGSHKNFDDSLADVLCPEKRMYPPLIHPKQIEDPPLHFGSKHIVPPSTQRFLSTHTPMLFFWVSSRVHNLVPVPTILRMSKTPFGLVLEGVHASPTMSVSQPFSPNGGMQNRILSGFGQNEKTQKIEHKSPSPEFDFFFGSYLIWSRTVALFIVGVFLRGPITGCLIHFLVEIIRHSAGIYNSHPPFRQRR